MGIMLLIRCQYLRINNEIVLISYDWLHRKIVSVTVALDTKLHLRKLLVIKLLQEIPVNGKFMRSCRMTNADLRYVTIDLTL
jgi:hypothetical protein